MSADMAAESFSLAHCRHFRTIKHFHGIPWRRDGWRWRKRGGEEGRDEGKEEKPNEVETMRGIQRKRKDHRRKTNKK